MYKVYEQRVQEGEKTFVVCKSYNHKNKLVGDIMSAKMFAERYGLRAEKIKRKDVHCSIGFSEAAQAWCGWNKQGFRGFPIGYKIQEKDLEHTDLPLDHEVLNHKTGKRLAISFARLTQNVYNEKANSK